MEDGVDEKYYLNADVIDKLVQHRERHKELGHGFGAKFHSKGEKMQALKVGGKGIDDLVCVPCDYRYDEGIRFKAHGKTGTLLSRARNDESCGQMVCVASLQEHATVGINKSTPMVAAIGMVGGYVPIINPNKRIRRLTPTECSRLQTIPEWYRWECSDTQAYRMLGNGWTVEVIKHIFNFIEL